MTYVLLLNADWAPLQFINGSRALKLLLKERAEVIVVDEAPSMWNEFYRTVSTSFQIPATIRLHLRVNTNQKVSRFKKAILYNRDNWSCQYCHKKLGRDNITIDHIIPKCHGGKTTWKNCVVCCKACNRNKGSLPLREVNMHLIVPPLEPRVIHFWNLHDKKDWHKDWSFFVDIRN